MNASNQLTEKTLLFAKESRKLVHDLPQTCANQEDGRQLIIASGLLAAHYIEGAEAVNQEDMQQAYKTCIKDAKQSSLWLELFDCGKDTNRKDLRAKLLQDSEDIQKTLTSILQKES